MSKKYFNECSSELSSASTHDELLRASHSFDRDQLTRFERDSLNRLFCEKRDEIRGYKNDLSTDYDLANFCRGGDLDED